MKRVFRRPSPAMVIAIVALVAALGGTAIGAAFVTKKQAKKIAKNQVNKLAPGLSVNHAKTADSATNATNANTANSAKNVFFAVVDYNTPTPAVVSGSPGISGDGEDFLGAPRLTFPRDMTGCSLTANFFTGGPNGYVRQSTNSSGSLVVMKLTSSAGADVRQDFNLVAVCPA